MLTIMYLDMIILVIPMTKNPFLILLKIYYIIYIENETERDFENEMAY